MSSGLVPSAEALTPAPSIRQSKAASTILKNDGGGEVRIHSRDGRMREANSHGTSAPASQGDGVIELDRVPGIERTFDPQVVKRLEKTHSEDQADVRSVCGAVFGRMFVVVAIASLIVLAIFVVGSLMDITRPAPSSLLEQYFRAWRHFDGAVTPGLALTVNLALLALVLPINLALGAATSRGNRRDDAISSAWRQMLGWCPLVAGAGALGFSILQVTGIGNGKADYGVVAASVFVGLFTVFLAVTVVEFSSTVKRARDFNDAEKQLQAISDWKEVIRARGVPDVPLGPGLRLKLLPKVPRIVLVVLLFVLLSFVYTYGALECLVWTHRGRFVIPLSGWSDVLFAIDLGAYSAAIAYVIGNRAWQRWSTPARFVGYRVTIWPLTVRVLYLIAISLLMVMLGMDTAQDWPRGIRMAIVLAGPFVVLPCAAWIVLWQSRKLTLRRASSSQPDHESWGGKLKAWPGDAIIWLAAPVWQNVSKSLDSYDRRTINRRDRAYDHEIEADVNRATQIENNAASTSPGRTQRWLARFRGKVSSGDGGISRDQSSAPSIR